MGLFATLIIQDMIRKCRYRVHDPTGYILLTAIAQLDGSQSHILHGGRNVIKLSWHVHHTRSIVFRCLPMNYVIMVRLGVGSITKNPCHVTYQVFSYQTPFSQSVGRIIC